MKKLLIVEDDSVLAASLARTFSRRGYNCLLAATLAEADIVIDEHKPTHCLLDLNLGDESTQGRIATIREKLPKTVIVILTGYGTIPSTVKAIKDGADQYFLKPIEPDILEEAFDHLQKKTNQADKLWKLEDAHILKVLNECGGNVSQAAIKLGIHRRTLQRKIKKLTK